MLAGFFFLSVFLFIIKDVCFHDCTKIPDYIIYSQTPKFLDIQLTFAFPEDLPA